MGKSVGEAGFGDGGKKIPEVIKLYHGITKYINFFKKKKVASQRGTHYRACRHVSLLLSDMIIL